MKTKNLKVIEYIFLVLLLLGFITIYFYMLFQDIINFLFFMAGIILAFVDLIFN